MVNQDEERRAPVIAKGTKKSETTKEGISTPFVPFDLFVPFVR